MNNQNKYNCFLIYNINNQDYDSSPLGGYNDLTAPLFQPSWLTTAAGLTELMWRHLVLSYTFLSRGEGNALF